MHQYYEKVPQNTWKVKLIQAYCNKIDHVVHMDAVWGRITSLGITFVVTTGISISWGTELNLLGFVNA